MRILFCDDPPFLSYFAEDFKFNRVNNFKEMDGYKILDPIDMFDKDKKDSTLSEWIKQPIIMMESDFKYPKFIQCKFCNFNNNTGNNNSMGLRVTPKIDLLTFTCDSCGKANNDLDVTALEDDAVEGKIESHIIQKREEYTIEDVIKGYTNKQGGAHVEQKVSSNGIVAEHLGQERLFTLGIYASEQINKILND